MIRIGITMGCPAGIGPDVILKAAAVLPQLPYQTEGARVPGNTISTLPEKTPPLAVVVLGDPRVLQERAKQLGITLNLHLVHKPEEAASGVLNLLPLSELEIEPGRPTLKGSKAMVRYIRKGVELCLSGRLHGLVTAPISKIGLTEAGEPFPGHTEMLAALTGTKDYTMAFYGERLSIVLTTIHQALREAIAELSVEKILRVTRLAHRFLKEDLGLPAPRLALAALNPHAGEGGLFGDEESRILKPAVDKTQAEGIPLYGPYPADSLFFRAAQGEFDLVVALYHDQGLIPFKLLHFRDGVNVTLGLPIVRTSVDHGTAYELAGTGKADPASLIAAVRLAFRMASRRNSRSQALGDPENPCRSKA